MSQLYASKDIDGYLIECLKQPECYPHATKDIRVIESDLSWVILTGDFAYKIKKKIDLYYLDASTLARRKQLCEDEVRLNRRTFPELYLGTVSIAQKENGLCINGNGEVLEYAIQMQQFDPDKTLDKLHNIQEITLDRIESMVSMLVKFHEQAPIAGIETAFGEPNSLYAPVQLNFDQVRPCLTEPRDISQLVQLEAWANEFLKRLWPRFAERKDLGMIRECHGDAHLGNFVLSNDDCVKLFDCIEYRAEFRWIDGIITDLEGYGLSIPKDNPPSTLLGVSEMSPLGIAACYQALFNRGFRMPLTSIRTVMIGSDIVTSNTTYRSAKNLPENHSVAVDHGLRTAVRNGTGRAFGEAFKGFDVAGKTGTTDDGRDAWFVGADGKYLALAWVGRDDNKATNITGSNIAVPIVLEILKGSIVRDRTPELPTGMAYAWINRAGSLSKKNCPSVRKLPIPIEHASGLVDDCNLDASDSGEKIWWKNWFGSS